MTTEDARYNIKITAILFVAATVVAAFLTVTGVMTEDGWIAVAALAVASVAFVFVWMEYNNGRGKYIKALIVCWIAGVALTIAGVKVPMVALTIAGGLLIIIGSLCVIAWIVNYLHELDARITEQEKRRCRHSPN